MNWKEISITDKPVFDEYLPKLATVLSDYCFGSLFFWRDTYKFRWCEVNDCLIVAASWQGEDYYLMPIGEEQSAMLRAINKLASVQQKTKSKIKFRMVDMQRQQLMRQWFPSVFVKADRDNFDYLHYRYDLAELKGRNFESRRNHINRFVRNQQNWQIFPLWPEIIDDCLVAYMDWDSNDASKSVTLAYERLAIPEALQNISTLGWFGSVLTVKGKVVAFSAGETINRDTAVVHIEKANYKFEGSYQLICREFARNLPDNIQWINREEDMGIEELRRSKLSWRPSSLLEKYDLTLMI